MGKPITIRGTPIYWGTNDTISVRVTREALEEALTESKRETFTSDQVRAALASMLDYCETFAPRGGYYQGNGWAARCLRYHLEELQKGDSK